MDLIGCSLVYVMFLYQCPVAAYSSQECSLSPLASPLRSLISSPPSSSLAHPLNSVQTSALNLDSLRLTKHMECYCSGMLQVWAVFSECVCVSVTVFNHAHVLKQMRASRMIMIMVRVCVCVPPHRTE